MRFLRLLLLLVLPVSVFAQPATPAPPDIDPNAMAALDKMGAYLRTLTAFQVQAHTTLDEVLTDGQKIQYAADVDLVVRRPDRLRAEIVGDRNQRAFFYDGKTFTLYAPRLNYYAAAPAPATLRELRDALVDRFGIELPLGDLFHWGVDATDPKAILGATDAGASQVDGVTCQHYVYRQAGLDWQLWMQLGDYPLPRRLVLTSTEDMSRPEYTSVLTWNLAPSFNDAAFTFDAPPEAKKITFAEAK